MHFRRFEFKYVVPRFIADRIIPELLNYMRWDAYAESKEYYDVHSLYFDSPQFKNYYEKIFGIKNRKKPRIRLYFKELSKNKNVFFEIKRRSDQVILKDRAIISTEKFTGFLENPFGLLKNSEYDQTFFNEFIYEFANHRMQPAVLVSYKRRPFFSKFNDNFRVTFDYDLEVARPQRLNFDVEYKPIWEDSVIVEVKYNGTMPAWFRSIIEEYKLFRGSFSKYCEAVQACYNMPE